MQLKKQKTTDNVEDIQKLLKYYQEILILKEQYDNAIIGRNAIANEIKTRILLINAILNNIGSIIHNLNINFMYAEYYLNDYEKALKILLRLANESDKNFILKKITIFSNASFESVPSDHKYEKVFSKVWIIGENDALHDIEDNDVYSAIDFNTILTDLLKKGFSLILLTDFCNERFLKPSINFSENIQVESISVGEIYSNVLFYLSDEHMKNIFNRFKTFISKNGADIMGMDENLLFDAICTIKIDSANLLVREKSKKDN